MIGYFADEAKTILLGVGATMKAPDGNIYKGEVSDDQLYTINQGERDKKKQECRQTILSLYSESDQINILMSQDQTRIAEMKSKIDPIITEYRTKGKNADYSKFK